MAGFDNTSGVASGGVPYQPAYTIQPKYGFRYSTQPFVDPYQDTYNPKYTAPPQKQIIPPNSTVPIIENNDSNNNDVANANQSAVTQMSIDAAQAANTRDYDLEEKGVFDRGQVYGPSASNALGAMIPGYGFMSGLTGPAVPTSGYGSPGSISSLTGGVFDDQSRSYNPVTGVYNQEYGTQRAFTDRMVENPVGMFTGDPKNAYDYQDVNAVNANTMHSKSMQQSVNFIDTHPMHAGKSEREKDNLKDEAAKIHLMDMGIPEHSAEVGTPTHDAMVDPSSYSDSGAAPKGSQYSKTGVFSSGMPSGGVDVSDPNSTGASTGIGGSASGVSGLGDESGQGTGSSSSSATAGQDTATSGPTGTSYADDAQGSGGGGGK